MTANDRLLPQSAWRAVIEAASPSEDEGLCRAKSRQRRRAVLAPLERAPRLRSGMRPIGFPLGDPRPLPTPMPPNEKAPPDRSGGALSVRPERIEGLIPRRS